MIRGGGQPAMSPKRLSKMQIHGRAGGGLSDEESHQSTRGNSRTHLARATLLLVLSIPPVLSTRAAGSGKLLQPPSTGADDVRGLPDECANSRSCQSCLRTRALGCRWCAVNQECRMEGNDAHRATRILDQQPMDVEDVLEERARQQQVCAQATDCRSCVLAGDTCGWVPGPGWLHGACSANSSNQGWTRTSCLEECPSESTFHDMAGMIELGGLTPMLNTGYRPNQVCVFTIWPMLGGASPTSPDGGDGTGTKGGRTLIRLQFEWVDLGPSDHIDIFANGIGASNRLTTISGSGAGVVNRIITARASSLTLQLVAEGAQGGTGFRCFYRVIDGSPLDVYLISAIIVTSILTCILCSCCCNSCISLLAGHTARRWVPGATGGAGAGGLVAAPRALSAEEKARLPIVPYGVAGQEQQWQAHAGDEGDRNIHGESSPAQAFGKCPYWASSHDCCICLMEFEIGDVIRCLPCGHGMHAACVDTWLEVSTCCPLCKKDVRDDIAHMGSSGNRRGDMRRTRDSSSSALAAAPTTLGAGWRAGLRGLRRRMGVFSPGGRANTCCSCRLLQGFTRTRWPFQRSRRTGMQLQQHASEEYKAEEEMKDDDEGMMQQQQQQEEEYKAEEGEGALAGYRAIEMAAIRYASEASLREQGLYVGSGLRPRADDDEGDDHR